MRTLLWEVAAAFLTPSLQDMGQWVWKLGRELGAQHTLGRQIAKSGSVQFFPVQHMGNGAQWLK